MGKLAASRRPWTESDDVLLERLYGTHGSGELIAMRLGRTLVAVHARARRIGLARHNQPADHGYGLYSRGCRCDICKAAKVAYMTERRRCAYLETIPVVQGITHGRYGYEERGCRCEVCVAAYRQGHPYGPGWCEPGR